MIDFAASVEATGQSFASLVICPTLPPNSAFCSCLGDLAFLILLPPIRHYRSQDNQILVSLTVPLEPIGNIQPAEAEDLYYAAADNIDMAA